MFDLQWQDPNEMTKYRLLKPGDATFVINFVYENNQSGKPMCSQKTGEAMIKIEFMVEDSDGNESAVDEYVLASQAWKLKQICDAIGKPEVYMDSKEGGFNNARIIGECGKCVIKTDVPSDPKYNERTVIAKFIPMPVKTEVTVIDDDLNF